EVASIADAQTWSTLTAKASGETVKGNPALLKKSIKREEKRKAKSTGKMGGAIGNCQEKSTRSCAKKGTEYYGTE
ncbi:hypothetical protein HK098_000679, partial [Nowakowskiella sp. JEL0407]